MKSTHLSEEESFTFSLFHQAVDTFVVVVVVVRVFFFCFGFEIVSEIITRFVRDGTKGALRRMHR